MKTKVSSKVFLILRYLRLLCYAKSDIIRKTGLLDIDFGPEDIEHAFRLKKYGELLVNLNYHAYHKVSQSIFVSGVKKKFITKQLDSLH